MPAVPRSRRPQGRNRGETLLPPLDLALLCAATFANGFLAGGSIDKSLTQLPARRTIGLQAMAAYNRATDMGPGFILYPAFGLGAPALTLAVAALMATGPVVPSSLQLWAAVAAVLSVGHVLTTSRAAPTLLRIRRRIPPEDELRRIYDRFARWQGARAVLPVSTFIATILALAAVGP